LPKRGADAGPQTIKKRSEMLFVRGDGVVLISPAAKG
jgi:hypothetical protein